MLTYVSTHCHTSECSIRYHTTEPSSWHHYITVELVQVNCSIISSVSEECSSTTILYWNHTPIWEESLSSSFTTTTWHPVSDALESIVWIWRYWEWSIGLTNLSDEDVTVVRIDLSIQWEVNSYIMDQNDGRIWFETHHKYYATLPTETLVDADTMLLAMNGDVEPTVAVQL